MRCLLTFSATSIVRFLASVAECPIFDTGSGVLLYASFRVVARHCRNQSLQHVFRKRTSALRVRARRAFSQGRRRDEEEPRQRLPLRSWCWVWRAAQTPTIRVKERSAAALSALAQVRRSAPLPAAARVRRSVRGRAARWARLPAPRPRRLHRAIESYEKGRIPMAKGRPMRRPFMSTWVIPRRSQASIAGGRRLVCCRRCR